MATKPPLNQTITSCPPSGIRRFFDIAKQMSDVIALGVGEPDYVTPERIRQAGIRSLNDGITGYTSNSGLLELRAAICDTLENQFGVHYSPVEECLISVGVSEALDLALRVLVNPGDEIIIPEPCYVSYVPNVQFVSGTPVLIPTRASDGFRIDPQVVEAAVTSRTKAILIASPANPTGATQSREDLQAIVDIAVKHNLYILSDEIYQRLTFDTEMICMGALEGAKERTVVLNGFSKSYAMTGWRVGYVCAPPEIITLMTRVHQYTMLCAPTMAQYAALEGLLHCERDVEMMVADYKERRELFVTGLQNMGLECSMPNGAFYAFPSIESTGLDCETFAERLLMEEHVAVVPGIPFGRTGDGHIRCCYATARPKLKEALIRMERFVEKVRRERSIPE